MERIRQLVNAFRAYFGPQRNHGRFGPMPPQQGPNAGRNGAPPVNPAAHAYQNAYAPRHADERNLVFRPVPPNGVMPQRTEQWFREGQTQRSRTQRSMVITASGAVVPPEQIKLKCICGRYEHVVQHCDACGRGLCKLCARKFHTASGREIILCENDLRIAIDGFNTWQRRQQQQS